MPNVARLSVAAVKSTRLHHPESIRLERSGAAGNRSFYIAEPDGILFTGSDFGPLVAVAAELRPAANGDREHLALRFPDGTSVEGDPSVLAAPLRTSFYGRPVDAHELDGPWSAALSRYVGRPLVLARPDRSGDANDDFAVSMFSTASAEDLARRSGSAAALDARRFRMLVEVGGAAPYQEDTWIGRRVRLGEAVVAVESQVARCVITTQNPSTGLKDFDTLKAIAAYRGLREGRKIDFGVYAGVVEPGTVRVGDAVEPADG